MSRTKYLNHLERQLDASRKTINDLTHEIFELRTLLKEASKQSIPTSKQPLQKAA